MLYFEMPFLPGLILMRLFPLVRWHYCQVWYWYLYALFWEVILVRFDINVCMPSFEMPFLSGLILMCLCPLLRCNFCHVWYWCLYDLKTCQGYFFVNVWRKNIFDIYVTEYGTALKTILPILFLYINTVIVTAGTIEPYWEREVWRLKIWFNPPFL
jgi:hypothetical protein